MSIDPTRRSLLGAAMIAAAPRAMPPLKTVRADLPQEAPVAFVPAMLDVARP